ncbi:MAG: sporulation protein YqfD [Firmicutes bacterium]|nr:sporulation protein YqfD [Bacillota bacterium]
MLSEWLWRQWTGWVKVRLHGPECEGVITDLIAQGQKVWGLSRRPGGDVDFVIGRPGVAALHRAARKRPVRVHFQKRGGVALSLKKLRARPMLAVGFVGALLAVLWFLGRIWIVDAPIAGQPAKVHQELVQAAYEDGLRPGVGRARVNLTEVAERMQKQLGGYFWVRLSLHGVVAEIQAAPVIDRPGYRTPSRLVAECAGTILTVEVYMGESLVARGERVRAGQTLIQGSRSMLALDGRRSDQVVAPAAGQVWAKVVHRVRVYQPLKARVERAQPGRFVRRQLLLEQGTTLSLTWGQPPFRQYRVTARTVPIRYRGVELPVEWRRVVYNKIKEHLRRLTPNQAMALAVRRAEREIASQLPTGGRWLTKARQVQQVQGGVWITLSWQAEQNIAISPEIFRRAPSDKIL